MFRPIVRGPADAASASLGDNSASAQLEYWLGERWWTCALFLDVDGTLLDIAESPEAVRVPGELRGHVVRDHATVRCFRPAGPRLGGDLVGIGVSLFLQPVTFLLRGLHFAEGVDHLTRGGGGFKVDAHHVDPGVVAVQRGLHRGPQVTGNDAPVAVQDRRQFRPLSRTPLAHHRAVHHWCNRHGQQHLVQPCIGLWRGQCLEMHL